MDPLIIALGGIAAAAAAGFVIASFVDENIIWLGVAAACTVGAYFGLYNGIHHEFAKFHAKHQAILTDLRSQGFKLASSDVYAVDGRYYKGTEADLALGKCLVPFITVSVHGVWRVALPARNPNNIIVLTPAQAATMGTACS